jgi:hypothetical protein
VPPEVDNCPEDSREGGLSGGRMRGESGGGGRTGARASQTFVGLVGVAALVAEQEH